MKNLKIYNTKSRMKEVFSPISETNVRMYVCGPTVYGRAHLGNARPVIVFDVMNRLLRHRYGQSHVNYVRNFTDVDDKINARAAETGRPISEITDETIKWFLEDMSAVGAIEPDEMPRATQYIAHMVAMIEGLVTDGFAYESDGHVLFRVRAYENYGSLSGRSLDDMRAGARVEIASYKEDPMDFVLWKPSNNETPGWDSPWGRGRPGWHIECSAMAHDLLGSHFDIHGGGNDLMFPHHENEIAQSTCAGHGFANYWMHNEMLQVEGRKMAKSLGNFFTVRDLLDQGIPGEVIRLVMMGTHYRKPMDWTDAKRDEAGKALTKWYAMAEMAPDVVPDEDFIDLLSDDLNTPAAIAYMHRLEASGDASSLRASLRFMGLMQEKVPDWASSNLHDLSGFEIILQNERVLAANTKDFTEVDRIRSMLLTAGVQVSMGKEGVFLSITSSFDPELLELIS
jgi:cysteinyl-tRNA synthetase